jgi:excisionase family DNA binding protein
MATASKSSAAAPASERVDTNERTPDLMVAAEVAAVLRQSADHILRRARRGQIPGAVRFGSAWRFRRDAIERYAQTGDAT